MRTESRPTSSTRLDGLVEPVDHVVLVPVERLQEQRHALACGVLAQLGEPGEQHLAVLRLRRVAVRTAAAGGRTCRTTRVSSRRLPPSSAMTESWDRICVIASARRSASNAPKKCSMSTHTVGMTTPAGAARRSSGSRFAQREVALAAQLDRVVAGGGGELPLRLQIGAGQELFLAGNGEHSVLRVVQHHLQRLGRALVEQLVRLRDALRHPDAVGDQRGRVDRARRRPGRGTCGSSGPGPSVRRAATADPPICEQTSSTRLWWNSSPSRSPTASPW